jgi:hypothetical protein
VDYWAARASVVWDVTPDIENYTVATYSHSKSTGVIPKIVQAFYREPYSRLTGVATGSVLDAGQTVNGLVTANGLIALDQMAYEAANCGGNSVRLEPDVGFTLRIENLAGDQHDDLRASDKLTVKGIPELTANSAAGPTLDLFGPL